MVTILWMARYSHPSLMAYSLVWLTGLLCCIYNSWTFYIRSSYTHSCRSTLGKCSVVLFLRKATSTFKSADILKVLCSEAEKSLADRWSRWTLDDFRELCFIAREAAFLVWEFPVSATVPFRLLGPLLLFSLLVGSLGGRGQEGSVTQVLLRIGSFRRIPEEEAFELCGHSIFRFLESRLYFFSYF